MKLSQKIICVILVILLVAGSVVTVALTYKQLTLTPEKDDGNGDSDNTPPSSSSSSSDPFAVTNTLKNGETSEEYPALKFYLLEDGTYGVGASYELKYEKYTDTDYKDIIIPSHFNGKEVSTVVAAGFKLWSIGLHHLMGVPTTNLRSITIPCTVRKIERYAFGYCGKLEKVVFEEGSQLTDIEDHAFYQAVGLPYLDIPDAVTSLGECAFYNCHSLEVRFSPNSQLKKIGAGAFSANYRLFSLELPSGVTEVGSKIFQDCTNLVQVYSDSASVADALKAYSNISHFPSGSEASELTYDENGFAFKKADKVFTITKNNGATEKTTKEVTYLWGYAGDETDIVLPSVAGGYYIRGYAFSGIPITSLTVTDSVNEIAPYAFKFCASLTSIDFDTVTLKEISNYAFQKCYSLTDITFAEQNIIKSIGSYAFEYCSSLRSLDLTPLKKLTSIGENTFADCTSLSSVSFPDSLEAIGGAAFLNCNLTEVVLTKGIKTIDTRTFSTTVNPVAEFRILTESITAEMLTEYGFTCTSFIYGTDAPSALTLTDDGFVFLTTESGHYLVKHTDTDIIDLVLPDNFMGEQYTVRKSAFMNRTKLQTLTIGKGVKAIDESAFYGCKKLSNITICDDSELNVIGNNAFISCRAIQTLDLTKATKLRTLKNCCFYDLPLLTDVKLPNGLETIASGVFSRCTKLEKLVIPDSVTDFRYTYFYTGTNLKELYLPAGLDFFKDINPYNPSYNLLKLHTLTFSGEPEHYKVINGAIYSADGKSLIYYPPEKACDTLTVPEGVTEISAHALANTNIKKVVLPSTVKTIGYSAFRNSDIESINLPSAVTAIESEAFANTELKQITVSSNVKKLGWGAFIYCDNLEKLVFNAETIPRCTFDGCTALKKITIGENCTEIGDSAFLKCTSLNNIDIPKSVTKISDTAFRECTSLASITVNRSNPTYASFNGDLYTKNLNELIHYAMGKKQTVLYILPGTVTIRAGAISANSALTMIHFSSPNGWDVLNSKGEIVRENLSLKNPEDNATLVCKTYRDHSFVKK